jgi:hypothetical protein
MLGIQLTDAEALTFAKLQSQILVAFSVPSSAMPVLRGTLGVDKTLEEKASWLTRYEAALHKISPDEMRTLGPAKVTQLASMLMDALLFAGGISVPNVIAYALAIPYSAWGERHLPQGFSLDQPKDIEPYVAFHGRPLVAKYHSMMTLMWPDHGLIMATDGHGWFFEGHRWPPMASDDL